MPTLGVWGKVPELWAFVAERHAAGRTAPEIAAEASERFGVKVSSSAVWQKVAHMRSVGQVTEPDPVADLISPVPGGFARDDRKARMVHPKGWEPHVEEHGDTATAVSEPTENASADEADLIRGWNLNPDEWRIVGHLNCRRWQANTPVKGDDGRTVGYEQKWLYYYKASLERVTSKGGEKDPDIAALCALIENHKPQKAPRVAGDPRAFIVAIADLQMGKADGDGTPGIVGRFTRAIDSVEQRIAELRLTGRPLESLYILGLGDLIEQCSGHYPQQEWRTQLNLRDQLKVTRRLIIKALERWAPMFSRVVVAAIPGNHGEVRANGKSFTDFADNFDVSIFEEVSEVLAYNPAAYGHVSFKIPQDALSMTLDVHGTIVGIAHGHQAGRGANAQQKIENWWKDQGHGGQPVGDADILVTGHYHHFSIVERGRRVHIQCPALDGGSDWWRNVSGQESRPGVLTFVAGGGSYSDLQIL